MSLSKILVIGGTGAQGIPVVRGLVSGGRYAVRVLTRDPESQRAKTLLGMSPKVELSKGNFTSETDIRNGLQGCDGVFLNIDGFTVGEEAEMFWTMRIYELSVQYKIKHFVFGNLDYGFRKGGYNEMYRTGHYDGKGRMADWLLNQNNLNKKQPLYDMKVAIFTTGPYMEMALAGGTPMAPSVKTDEETGQDVVIWQVPLTEDGAVVHVSLEDCAHYVRWLFDHPERDGFDLEVAIEHVHYADLAAAFERVTGCKAKFVDISMEEYWTSGPMSKRAAVAAALEADIKDPGTMTMKENFTGFWNMWRGSGRNQGVIRRDYALLNEIHPQRIRTVEQFLRLADEKAKGEGSSLLEHVKAAKPLMKLQESRMAGRL